VGRKKDIGAKVALSLLTLALFVTPVFSQKQPDSVEEETTPVLPPRSVEKQYNQAILDTLYVELKEAETSTQATEISKKIMRMKFFAGGDTISAIMKRVSEIMSQYDPRMPEELRANNDNVANALLQRIIDMNPKYAESYNHRSVLNLRKQDYDSAINDIAMTLSLDNRHYDAMLGLARVYHAQHNDYRAMIVIMKVLDIYPLLIPARDLKFEIENTNNI